MLRVLGDENPVTFKLGAMLAGTLPEASGTILRHSPTTRVDPQAVILETPNKARKKKKGNSRAPNGGNVLDSMC